jgi:hypothetical protein
LYRDATGWMPADSQSKPRSGEILEFQGIRG